MTAVGKPTDGKGTGNFVRGICPHLTRDWDRMGFSRGHDAEKESGAIRESQILAVGRDCRARNGIVLRIAR